MNFTDEIFLLFLPAAWALYYIFPLRVRQYILLAASLFFYWTWGVEKFPLLLAGLGAAWLSGLGISATAPGEKGMRRLRLWTGIGVLSGLLLYTKAGPAIAEAIGAGEVKRALVPLGISYYTLSLIGYLLDVYYGKIKAERNILRLLLFAVWFPAILQGPIARYPKLGAQLREGKRFDYQGFTYGLQLMLYGYFKKLVLAERLNVVTGTLLGGNSHELYGGALLAVGLVFRSLQIYCDFSGYMDIAEGISETFGIRLEQNFRRPFFSQSAAEFWRRWHITLGAWFKDYIYLRIATAPAMIRVAGRLRKRFGKRAGQAFLTVPPLLVVWILTGLWHGTTVRYLYWGIYWGVLIALSTVLEPELKKLTALLHIRTDAPSWRVFRMARTFLLFTIGRWITIESPLKVLRRIMTKPLVGNLFDGSLYTLGLNRPNFLLMVCGLFVVLAVSILQERGSVRERVASWNIVFRWSFYILAILSVVIFGMYGLEYNAADFIYMQF